MDLTKSRTALLLPKEIVPDREACFDLQSVFNPFSEIFRAQFVALLAAEFVSVQNSVFGIVL